MTDGLTMSPIELSWTAKKEGFLAKNLHIFLTNNFDSMYVIPFLRAV